MVKLEPVSVSGKLQNFVKENIIETWVFEELWPVNVGFSYSDFLDDYIINFETTWKYSGCYYNLTTNLFSV